MPAPVNSPAVRPAAAVSAGLLVCNVRVRVETPADRDRDRRDLKRRLAETEHLPRCPDDWHKGLY